MGLRSLSNTSFPSQGMPQFSAFRDMSGQPSFGGGKGTAGSSSQQANPQSQFLQQLLPMLMARRAQQMQQAPAFMTPAQRLAQMPAQALSGLTQATPPPLFGGQISPGMQAQQAAAATQAQQAAQRTAAPTNSGLPAGITGTEGNYLYNGMPAWLGPTTRGGPNNTWYYTQPATGMYWDEGEKTMQVPTEQNPRLPLLFMRR